MSSDLTFINLSGSKPRKKGTDLDTQTRVRSHVMKNVRRRQRLEDTRSQSQPYPIPPEYEDSLRAAAGKSIQVTPSRTCETCDQDSSSVRSSSLETPGSSGKGHASAVSNAPENQGVPLESFGLAPVAATHRGSRSAPFSLNQQAPREDYCIDEEQPETPKVIADNGRVLLPTPFFGSQIGDSVSSTVPPKEFSKLLSTMETYSSFLSEPLALMGNHPRPFTRSQRTLFQNCFEDQAFDELILFTIRLSHLGHTTAIAYRSENVPLCVHMKANALSRIQHHVSTTTEMPPIPLIGAIMFFLSFEIIRDGPAVPIHLAGLARLVKMRGGLASLPGPPYPIVPGIVACDLTLAATTSRMDPVFVQMGRPRLKSGANDMYTDLHQSSPLMQFESFQGLRRLYRDTPDVLVDVLEQAFLGTCKNLATKDISSRKPADRNMQQMFQEKESRYPRTEIPFVVAESCSVAGTIYYRATHKKIPFEDPVNRDDSKRLGAFLNSASLDDWRGIPYLYLWVILTGAAAAQCHPERQYLVARLFQFGFSIGLEQEEDFKQICLNFIWLRHQIRASEAAKVHTGVLETRPSKRYT
ncbi:uncharacterized protein A1O9_00110 [Exophiala aquamarina CBS 119918]|uniref:Transcription factor domain-containing protein n=1 Tax=Exophiala aquamarina CBS 119918 TaxID=1182545 RepID=A0A072PS21_9EURO|nr:uncharacterized protein A1O9_00110 [Exophiala aquamarina CBS 119918]KEF62138.1 hypothetical protein A1O9_00110 [Exophiala aquamarina CBS 119918]